MTNAPTLFDWMGGREKLNELMSVFYRKVAADDLLQPLFQRMKEEHPEHVGMWLEEVLGGAKRYTEQRGGFKAMIRQHRGRKIAPEQRARWVALFFESVDEVGLPTDPEFRSALVAYIEWGSRRAMANSQPDAPPSKRETIKLWGWGEAPPGTD
ncbi:oxidoreductase [Xaviernesmea oryzae]|uniref:Oxidoreductase n=1 Tax=Xaviernesmea oryzae TaxID=464029 RepID=A0A1Q9AU17_9HYPH|nr:group II truncated hemoglobin [Xaviernesmea oryzae]OLP58915.1 oxidoreductase [Xaviernesmea oryzae]SEM02008.1 hemoglobin [Xaviernesmea oryzae]